MTRWPYWESPLERRWTRDENMNYGNGFREPHRSRMTPQPERSKPKQLKTCPPIADHQMAGVAEPGEVALDPPGN